ncbi:hypothetical protein MKQ68_20365 [Chitinophaga horti]|uniref:Uncharacterized protein n=1 Tax=Chitinophaga horti TaxID=2920382 RepID=A0ABY6J260_9BACT|nr:hypothetical protein [Chitinophaga horti]UYQ92441.1 hypothetical protein MKQ68_20365 [Chitinophaga horti]
MGNMTSIIKFSGRMGNVISYRVKGEQRVRSVPEYVHQTPATKRAAKDFGTASSHAAVLRNGIVKDIVTYHDDTFANRLNKAMVAIVKADAQRQAGRRQVTLPNLRALEGMQINQHRSISCSYSAQRTYNGNIEVTVTQPRKQFHAKTNLLQFRAVAVFFDFAQGTSQTISSETVTLSDQQTPDAFCLTIPSSHSGPCMIILEAIYCKLENGVPYKMGNRKFNAMDIIAILPPTKETATKPATPPAENEKMQHTKRTAKRQAYLPPG